MPLDAPPPPLPGPTPPALPTGKPRRPPVAGWMWLLFTAGPVAAGAVLGLIAGLSDGGRLNSAFQGILGGMAFGGFCIPVLLGGMALSGRFFEGTGPRIVGALMFSGLLVVGLGAVFFAGCMCLVGDSPKFYR